MRLRPICLVVASLLPVVVHAQTRLGIDRPSPDVVVINIGNGGYGSLAFDGSIERVDMGEEWEFRTRLFATFHANTKPNETARVDLTAFRFVATNPRPDRPNGPADLVFERSEPIELHLAVDGDRKAIPDVSFRVPKQAVAAAAFTGISVRSERLLWPIPTVVKLVDPALGRAR